MGLCMALDLCVENTPAGVLGDFGRLIGSGVGSGQVGAVGWGGEMLLFGAVAGLAGSLVRLYTSTIRLDLTRHLFCVSPLAR